jgi:ATP adenylyltransferase
MRRDNTLLRHFDRIADTYTNAQRLPSACAASIVEAILNGIPRDRCSTMVDIGCGDAYLSSLLLRGSESLQCILVDMSVGMLKRARQRLSSLRVLDRAKCIRADACNVPLPSDSVSLVLVSFVIHLLLDPVAALEEIRRIVMPEGRLLLVTYDPNDLSSHIHNRCFPGYRELNTRQFAPIPRLSRLLSSCRFADVAISRYPYGVRFKNVDEVVRLTWDRPFSALRQFEDRVFDERMKEFELNLRRHFGPGEVSYESRVTLLSAKKPSARPVGRAKSEERSVVNSKCVFCMKFGEDAGAQREWFDAELANLGDFVVVPSLGPFAEGCLMILTRHHYCSMAHLPAAQLARLAVLKSEVREVVTSHYRAPIVFEHGPSVPIGDAGFPICSGGCCIDHAHFQVLPIEVDLLAMLKERHTMVPLSDLSDLAGFAVRRRPYVYFEDQQGRMYVGEAEGVPRQYLRRLIAERLGIPDRWDYDFFPNDEMIAATIGRLTPWPRKSGVATSDR